MSRHYGAAWAAKGRDEAHLRTASNPIGWMSNPQSPLVEPPVVFPSSNPPAMSAHPTQHAHHHERTDSASSTIVHNREDSHSFPSAAQSPGASQLPSSSGVAAPAQWKKILYEKQPFEDNYVDPEFMRELRTNENLRQLRYLDILRDTFAIVQQMSLVVIFTVVFAACRYEMLGFAKMLLLDAFSLISALLAYIALEVLVQNESTNKPTTGKKRGQRTAMGMLLGYLGRSLLFALILLVLAPLFHTMTRSYANDTITAFSVFLCFVHLVFADYDYLNGTTTKYTHTVSMNVSIVATTLLASRLDNQFSAAALVGFGILCFTLSPLLRNRVKRASAEAHVALTFTLCGVALGCLVQMSPILAGGFLLAVIAATLVLPYAFVMAQSGEFKVQISGPWDEAKPQNSAAAKEWATAGLLK